jgi:paraquat-inducible protein A
VLAGPPTGRVDVPLALSVAALLLLLPAISAPLMTISSFGATRVSWMFSGARALWRHGFPSISLLVAAFTLVLPFVYLGLLIWVLAGLHLRLAWRLGPVFRWAKYLRPWMMLEVYLLGCFVAYSRMRVVFDVDIGLGGWFLLFSALMLMVALTQLDERTVWEALPRPAASPATSNGSKTMACTVCDLIVDTEVRDKQCSRCGATLRVRKPGAMGRTTALVVAGFVLYVPANILTVLTTVRFGREEHNTIMSGVLELVSDDLAPLALIVFVASIVLPLTKLCGLTWMLIATRLRSRRLLVERTRLFRMIDLIGRWSNIDLFMSAVLVALVRFGSLTSVRLGNGMVAFASVVVLTMIATIVFDARLMWDASRSTT